VNSVKTVIYAGWLTVAYALDSMECQSRASTVTLANVYKATTEAYNEQRDGSFMIIPPLSTRSDLLSATLSR
jgi:hypothetical protein